MTDGDALLKAIIQHPGEDVPRLVYADWLDENGEPERAEFVRVQVELARGPDGIDCTRVSRTGDEWECFPSADFATSLPRMGSRATVRVLTGAAGPRRWLTVTGTVRGWGHHTTLNCLTLVAPRGVEWKPELGARERELLEGDYGRNWRTWSRPAQAIVPVGALHYDHITFRRGFVESVTCTAADWLAHADELVASHPIECVTITDATTGWDARIAQFDSYAPDGTFGCKRWPRIRFTLPRNVGFAPAHATA